MDGDPLLDRVRMSTRSDLDDLARDLKIDSDDLRGLSTEGKCDRLAEVIRSVAGHTAMNAYRRARGMRLTYREILIDVADKLTPGIVTRSGFHTKPLAELAEIEEYIAAQIRRSASESLKAMSTEDRRQVQLDVERRLREQGMPDTTIRAASAAVLSGGMSGAMLATAASAALYSSLWTALVGLSARQVLVGGLAVGGPVGVVAGVLMFLTSPSYSKLIPAVVRLVFIVQSHQQRAALARELS